jgi:uncharacterized membrane protein YidH (DUF202 family)
MVDWLFEAISLAALTTVFAVVAAHWTELPAQVPTHFGASGFPNGWGDKSGLWVLPLTSVIVYIGLTLASRYQRFINIPFRIERNTPEVRRLLLSMSIVLKTVLLLVFAYIAWANVNTALGRSEGLGRYFLPVSLALISTPLALYLLRLWHYRKS